MQDKQKINCTVESCKYNDCDSKECMLKAIIVEESSKHNNNIFEDQSMCGSFVKNEENFN